MRKEKRSGSRAFANTSVTAIVGVGQLPAITGSELAAASSNHFGRKVVFERLQPKEFGKLLAPLFEGGAVAEVVAGYDAKDQTTDSTVDMGASTPQLLGITLRTGCLRSASEGIARGRVYRSSKACISAGFDFDYIGAPLKIAKLPLSVGCAMRTSRVLPRSPAIFGAHGAPYGNFQRRL